ncbi:hypothetical protein [Metabacillus niabensis]|uniref:hypothetical protein n=1 Tax=Metabacillus niabensis TaxID=324854 RepID=UPI001CFB60DA|nr:hypothetical protein [Metabacillus niabensis]
MEDKIKELETEIERLKERVGHWKRLAKGQKPRNEWLKESHYEGNHYKHLVLTQWPDDFPLNETLYYIKTEIIPKYEPYVYDQCYRTNRLGWVVVLVKHKQVDMWNDLEFFDQEALFEE